MQADDSGRGYRLVGEDGSVESFGDAGVLGDARTIEPGPGTGGAITSASGTLLLGAADGTVVPPGSPHPSADTWEAPQAGPRAGSGTTPSARGDAPRRGVGGARK